MNEKITNKYLKFLNPDELKYNLIQTALYLTSYEMFKSSIIDEIKGFFTFDFKLDDKTKEMKPLIDTDYKVKVLHFNPKDEFNACCLWLHNLEIINSEDLEAIEQIRKHRNQIAHESIKFLADTDYINEELLVKLITIKRKIDVWWIKEVHMPTNPDFDHVDYDKIDWDNVKSGSTTITELMLSIFNGNDEQLKNVHKAFMAELNKKKE